MANPFATISIVSGTTQAVVAAVPNRKIRVLNYTLISDTAGTYKFQSASTDITGAIPVAANGGASPNGHGALPDGQIGLFETAAGEALNLVFSTTANIGGHLAYQLRP